MMNRFLWLFGLILFLNGCGEPTLPEVQGKPKQPLTWGKVDLRLL
jgi:hypothetical protein